MREEPPQLVFNEAELSRIFRRRRRVIADWIASGHLPARELPDGRVVVLEEELLAMLRSLPRPGAQREEEAARR